MDFNPNNVVNLFAIKKAQKELEKQVDIFKILNLTINALSYYSGRTVSEMLSFLSTHKTLTEVRISECQTLLKKK